MSWQSHLMPVVMTLVVVMMSFTAGLLAAPLDCPTIYGILAKHWKKSLFILKKKNKKKKPHNLLLTLTKQSVLPQPEEADVNLCSRESRSALFTIRLNQPCCSVSREQHSTINLPSKCVRQKQTGCTSAYRGHVVGGIMSVSKTIRE